MGMATKLPRTSLLPPLAELEAHLQSGEERAAAVLAVRLPQFAQIAWSRGQRAARLVEVETANALARSAVRFLRGTDRLAHDPGSDVFAVAMLGTPREARVLAPVDARAALERIVDAIGAATGLRAEAGWSLVRAPIADLGAELERALDRGARERERYEFFAAVGHELRTPLTSIRGYLDTVIDDALDDGTRRRFLETARREALRLGRLVDGMLDFSMLDLSGETFAPASCMLAEHLEAACEAIAPQLRERRINLIRYAAAPVRVGLGGDSCTQAIVNILDNAVKYGREGGTVRVGWCLAAPYACIRVDDDGPGILNTIVERAGGEVRAMRSPLGGARFELRVPIRELETSAS